MIRRYATAADFTRWQDAASKMTSAELHYASVDCFHTASNWRGVDDVVEGFYLDQGLTYSDELNRRRADR